MNALTTSTNTYIGSSLEPSAPSFVNDYYTTASSHQNSDTKVTIEPVFLSVGHPISGVSPVFVPMNVVIVGGTVISYPATWKKQLTVDYFNLGQSLADLKDPAADDWQIDEPVYEAATQVASALMAAQYPVPKLFSHGNKSVVFNWETSDNRNLYLTVSKDYVSGMVSSPARIERRVQMPVGLLINSTHASEFVEWTKSGRPVLALGWSIETTAF
jgi:hypothetical protein